MYICNSSELEKLKWTITVDIIYNLRVMIDNIVFCGCSRVHAVRWDHRPLSVIWSVDSAPALKATEACDVTSVRSATTVSRAVCRVIAMRPAVSVRNVSVMSVNVMIQDSVLARY